MMNKASGGDGIPAELFQILKDDAVKLLHSICQKIGKKKNFLGKEKFLKNLRYKLQLNCTENSNCFCNHVN